MNLVKFNIHIILCSHDDGTGTEVLLGTLSNVSYDPFKIGDFISIFGEELPNDEDILRIFEKKIHLNAKFESSKEYILKGELDVYYDCIISR